MKRLLMLPVLCTVSLFQSGMAKDKEVPTLDETFKALDADQSGDLSLEELLLKFDKAEQAARFLKKKDSNSDSKLTKQEAGVVLLLPNRRSAYEHLDSDESGKIELKEFLLGKKEKRASWFGRLDKNKDEKLSFEEFKPAVTFTKPKL